MANRFGINMGEVLRTAEAVKGARTQNALSDLTLQDKRTEIAGRPAEQERQNVLTELRTSAVGGDNDALQKYLALEPKKGPELIKALAGQDDRQREATKIKIGEAGEMAAFVHRGESQEEQKRRYGLVHNAASDEQRESMPQEYSPDFIALSMAKAGLVMDILENPESIRLGGEDVLYQGGKEIERASIPVKPGTGSGGGTKSADENLMYNQAAKLLGGTFDQSGQITILDPLVRNKVQSVVTEASKIYSKAGGKMTRSEAVTIAARKFGLDVKDAQPTATGDPQNIRNYLLNK